MPKSDYIVYYQEDNYGIKRFKNRKESHDCLFR